MRVVTRCICHNKTFEEIIKLANEKNIATVEDIQKTMGICNSCRLCNPYIENLLNEKSQTNKYEKLDI